ncbi:MAG: hypothetical protein ACRDPY_33515 [Streptosporangiaceae bacterium]
MVDDAMAFDADAIVIDPAVPQAARRALTSRFSARGPAARVPGRDIPARRAGAPDPRHSVPRSGRLIPFRQPAPPAPQPPRVMSDTARKVLNSAIFMVIMLGGALLAATAGSVPFVVVFLTLTVIPTVACARAVVDASDTGWTMLVTEPSTTARISDPGNWYARHAAAYYHRHYVVPRTDIAEADKPVWARAIAAANQIGESEVVRQRRIDSAQVAVALPQRLWQIAEPLARLSDVRERLQAERDDADFAARVTRLDQELARVARRIDKRVRRLEAVACDLGQADAVLCREAKEERLKEIGDLLLELRARTEDAPDDLDVAERMRLDAQAVIEQADEAARSLALPDQDEDKDEDKDEEDDEEADEEDDEEDDEDQDDEDQDDEDQDDEDEEREAAPGA